MPLTAESFEKFLALLSADREVAGEQYEIVRLKLTKYFELRMCAAPDRLADETIDRVARRLAEGERIQSREPMRYIYGVARNVFRETPKDPRITISVEQIAGVVMSTEGEEHRSARRFECLQSCLGELPLQSRDLLLRYYQESGQAKIEKHAATARQLRIPLNALRIRVHRIKAVVQRCMEKCMKDDEA